MIDYVISPKEGHKGRRFASVCAAFITANEIFPDAGGFGIRPVWAMFAGTEQELRPFVANLRLGRKAERIGRDKGSDTDMEFLKSARYKHEFQREAEGSLATLWYPELFARDPGMIGPDVRFVMIVPEDWAAAQRIDTQAALAHLTRLGKPALDVSDEWMLPAAYLFASYLDTRTRCPIVSDGRFFLQLLIAALDQGFAFMPSVWATRMYAADGSWSSKGWFRAHGLADVGIRHAIGCLGKHESVEAFLAEQTALYFKAVG